MADDTSREELPVIEDHESPVRGAVARVEGTSYYPLRSLEEAKSYVDGVVVLEGDYGGQIYVVCPASLVCCGQEALEKLLRDLDGIAWACNADYPRSAGVFYERLPVGSGVDGGMGGGLVIDGVWVHEELSDPRLKSRICEVIEGQASIRDDPQ